MGNLSSSPCCAFQVADYLDIPLCAEMLLLCKSISQSSTPGRSAWYRYLCLRFKEEFDLFIPEFDDDPALWPEFIQRFYRMRKRTVESEDSQRMAKFQIGVLCRLTSRKVAKQESTEREVVLPLHQQVSLLRERFPEISTSDALRAIMADRGRPPLEDPFCEADVKVKTQLCSEAEIHESQKAQQASILSATDHSILAVAHGVGLQNFEVDGVFHDMTSQEDVYRGQVRDIVTEFVNGINGCIICYGQTGSGKTYTMFGPPESPMDCQSASRGIAPRAFEDIFRARGNATIRVSYVEVYGNAITDLFNEGKIVGQEREGRFDRTRATDRVGHRYVLDGDTAVPVTCIRELEELLHKAEGFKRQAATAMNERSTRAHSVLVVHLTTRCMTSRLFLADLGGSERIRRSKADDNVKALVTVVGGEEESRVKFAEYYAHRERIQESMYINQGLFTLKNVIKALLKREQQIDMRIPYWDNKLTMLLAPGLGDMDSHTVVLCCLSMDPDSGYESLQTLRFAEACRNVESRVKGNDSHLLREALEKIDVEITELENTITTKERWEEVREERIDNDTLGGAFGEEEEKIAKTEVVVRSVLVGAEREREMLESLLARKRTMCGLDALGKSYGEKMEKQDDGGFGFDFRETSFSKKIKAKDFEDLMTLAETLRFLFRKTEVARSLCDETDKTARLKLKRENMPGQYYKWACGLREKYDNGVQESNFGKTMMDQCLLWKEDPDAGVRKLCEMIQN